MGGRRLQAVPLRQMIFRSSGPVQTTLRTEAGRKPLDFRPIAPERLPMPSQDVRRNKARLPDLATIVCELRTRREASRRMVSLDCGCADTWPCRCTQPPLSDRAVDSYRDAAQHILSSGMCPVIPIEILRALYRRGGDDRGIAMEIHERSAGVVA